MNKINELQKRSKEKKRKDKKLLLEGAKSSKILAGSVKELITAIQKNGLDYKNALIAISGEIAEAEKGENLEVVNALNQIRKSLPKAIQKVSISNPGAINQIDYKKLNSIADEVVKNFILNQNEHFNSFSVTRNRDEKVTQIKTEYNKFSITTKYRRNENGKLMGATSKKTNRG